MTFGFWIGDDVPNVQSINDAILTVWGDYVLDDDRWVRRNRSDSSKPKTVKAALEPVIRQWLATLNVSGNYVVGELLDIRTDDPAVAMHLKMLGFVSTSTSTTARLMNLISHSNFR